MRALFVRRITNILALVVALGAAVTCSSGRDDIFSIIVLPDTQKYAQFAANAPLFNAQTQWVVDHIQTGNERNIVFVTHVGDVVQNGSNTVEMARADEAMSILDGGPRAREPVVAWSILPGNHDYATTGDKATGTDLYLATFGPSRFSDAPWFGGADQSGNNTYQFIEAGNLTILHIAMEDRPTINVTNGPVRSPSPVEWAQDVIDAHPDLPVIISTHQHVNDDSSPGRSAAGRDLWEQLIRSNDQIFLVLCGHFGGPPPNGGEYHQVALNDFGKPVLEVLQDFQFYPNGGDGWLRIFTFDLTANAIRVETYSPVLDAFQTETVDDAGSFASTFEIDIDFAKRFRFIRAARDVFDVFTVESGRNRYGTTIDRTLAPADPAPDDPRLIVAPSDHAPQNNPSHALIAFPDFIGNDTGQLQPQARISSALLQLQVTEPGPGAQVFQMLTPWDAFTPWTDFGDDGVTPGLEAREEPLALIGAQPNPAFVGLGLAADAVTIDVSEAVQAWSTSQPNHGFGLLPFHNQASQTIFASSETDTPPILTIRSLKPGLRAITLRDGMHGYNSSHDTFISPGFQASTTAESSILRAGSGGEAALLRFDALFEPTGPISRDAIIRAAFLTLTGASNGGNAMLHRMIQPWDDSAAWSSTFGGDGLQTDDTEAWQAATDVESAVAGWLEFDVTDDIIAWQRSPSLNHGWAILPTLAEEWHIASSDGPSVTRPQLTVIFDALPCVADIADDLGFAGSDNHVGFGDFIRALGLLGPCPGQTAGCDFDIANIDGFPGGDGQVNFGDFLFALTVLGPCP